MSKEINLDAYYDDQRRVNALIGSTCASVPVIPENISRSRLLRAQVGLRHLLTEVIPQITDEQQRHEVYLWVDGIYGITCFEEVDAGIQP
ncbi:transcriptional regulator [Pectobacterium quasiaquaticum]|uniref:transcriptional regulator n=1 Tax=Pectobacterium quasiaquaticum TaxID=2774015 RepID=UPI001877406C|nr:transcriptional regulator [Pectobacterium quasiaquaticum]URG53038.1 transcriptional regulator [Pectobacterium quasiaquaticum]